MTIGAWFMLAISWSGIIFLCSVCLYKTIVIDRQNIHAPLEIESDDLGTK